MSTPTPPHAIVDARALPTYDLGHDHPFAPFRQQPLFELLEAHGWLPPAELLPVAPATHAELLLAHSESYVDFVERLSAAPQDRELVREAPIHGLGTADNPIAPGQHGAGAAVAGATLACARAVLSGSLQRTFQPTGGLHHAMPGAASGFCIYNDLVVAIREARSRGIARVLYVDYDVHHGDGVEFAFRDDPSVMTISFHETPDARWPFTGRVTDCGQGDARGSIVNMPFASHTGDESWLHCVGEVMRAACRQFRPELIVSQHGADPHWEDPLAELRLTTRSFERSARLTRELADEHCQGRWIATGGGGYQPIRVLPRAWAIVWSVVSGRDLPASVDAEWRRRWQSHPLAHGTPLAERFVDEPIEFPGAETAAAMNLRTLAALHEVHGW